MKTRTKVQKLYNHVYSLHYTVYKKNFLSEPEEQEIVISKNKTEIEAITYRDAMEIVKNKVKQTNKEYFVLFTHIAIV